LPNLLPVAPVKDRQGKDFQAASAKFAAYLEFTLFVFVSGSRESLSLEPLLHRRLFL
jgi:hypothetical protein